MPCAVTLPGKLPQQRPVLQPEHPGFDFPGRREDAIWARKAAGMRRGAPPLRTRNATPSDWTARSQEPPRQISWTRVNSAPRPPLPGRSDRRRRRRRRGRAGACFLLGRRPLLPHTPTASQLQPTTASCFAWALRFGCFFFLLLLLLLIMCAPVPAQEIGRAHV